MSVRFWKTTQRIRTRAAYLARIWWAIAANSTPIVIYTMGKVGSKSMMRTLYQTEGMKRRCFMTHFMWPDAIARIKADLAQMGLSYRRHYDDGLALYKYVIGPRRPVKIVTLVRDPISRDMSAYFQVLDRIWGVKNAHESVPFSDICDGFLNFHSYPGTDPITWFDDEFARVLGVNVFEHSFPISQGYMMLSGDNREILVMRTDLEDSTKEECLAEFLSCPGIQLKRANEGESKAYKAVYEQFKREVQLSPQYLDRCLDSKYCRHFFSQEELNEFQRRWEHRLIGVK